MEHGTSLSPADIALLGLLAEGPQHPWELSKQVKYREMRTWTELSQSTIYKQLRSLESRGLVAAAELTVAGRLRHQYSITEAGRASVAEGMLALLAQPTYPRWPIDIASYNIDLVDPGAAIVALNRYAEVLRRRADDWSRLEDFLAQSGCPRHRSALSRRARHMIAGELRWVEEFTAEIAAESGCTPEKLTAEMPAESGCAPEEDK